MVSVEKLVRTLMLSAFCTALMAPRIVWAQDENSHIDGMTGRVHVGKQLFGRYCFGCHGPSGDGNGMEAQWVDPRPRDFTAAVFKCRSTPTGTLPTDDDLYNAITRGFDTTFMPPWRGLPPNQRADLVAFIKTLSNRWKTEKPGTPITIPPETPLNIDSILRGRQIFQNMQCWKCHGPEGHGDGPSASTLTDNKDRPIRPYDFSTGTRFKCGATNADLYRIFMTGLDGTPMPSFGDQLKPEEAWDLVHFLRTLQVSLNSPELALFKPWQATHGGELKPLGPEQASGGER
jgi:cytochrome c oxidase cbb3-type subunit 2